MRETRKEDADRLAREIVHAVCDCVLGPKAMAYTEMAVEAVETMLATILAAVPVTTSDAGLHSVKLWCMNAEHADDCDYWKRNEAAACTCGLNGVLEYLSGLNSPAVDAARMREALEQIASKNQERIDRYCDGSIIDYFQWAATQFVDCIQIAEDAIRAIEPNSAQAEDRLAK